MLRVAPFLEDVDVHAPSGALSAALHSWMLTWRWAQRQRMHSVQTQLGARRHDSGPQQDVRGLSGLERRVQGQQRHLHWRSQRDVRH